VISESSKKTQAAVPDETLAMPMSVYGEAGTTDRFVATC
jgi:hypothetical protein